MAFSEKFIRGQLRLFRPFVTGGSLELTRKGQNRLGELMMAPHRKQIRRERLSLGELPCAWLRPRDEVRREILFYLHGGGYTCGGQTALPRVLSRKARFSVSSVILLNC